MQAAENTSDCHSRCPNFPVLMKEKEIHILGLYLETRTARNFYLHCAGPLWIRNRRNEELLALFQADGFPIKYEDLIHGMNTCHHPCSFCTRTLEKKAVSFGQPGILINTSLGDGKKYYRPKQMIEPEEAIRLIRVAGGLPAIAHPLQYKLGWKKTEQLLSYLKEAGMMGIEVYYSSHSQSDSLHLREIASRLGLVSTGGSDFHGANKPDIHLGSGYGGLRVSALLLDNIKARLQQKNS